MDKPETYPVEAIVNYFLDFVKRHRIVLTPMKLQKMLYFANGWSWAFYDKPIIHDECYAWEYGPVYPSVYHQYKSPIKATPIDPDHKMTKMHVAYDAMKFEATMTMPCISPEDEKAIELLESIGRTYGSFGAITLSDMTHVDALDNPWRCARQKEREHNILISEDIDKYFKRLKREGKLC